MVLRLFRLFEKVVKSTQQFLQNTSKITKNNEKHPHEIMLVFVSVFFRFFLYFGSILTSILTPFWHFGASKIDLFRGTGPSWSSRSLSDRFWIDLGGFGDVFGRLLEGFGEVFGGTAGYKYVYVLI